MTPGDRELLFLFLDRHRTARPVVHRLAPQPGVRRRVAAVGRWQVDAAGDLQSGSARGS